MAVSAGEGDSCVTDFREIPGVAILARLFWRAGIWFRCPHEVAP
jgi:hypothetical protein